MNFTPKTNAGAIVRGILTIAVVGLIIGWVNHSGVREFFQQATMSRQWSLRLQLVSKRQGPSTINPYPPGIRVSIGGKGTPPSSAGLPEAP